MSDLPLRWRYRQGRYWYRVPPGLEAFWDDKQEFLLGKTFEEAKAVFHDRQSKRAELHAYTLQDLFDRVVAEQLAEMPEIRAESYREAYERMRRTIGDTPLLDVTQDTIEHYTDYCRHRHIHKTVAQRDIEVLATSMTQAAIWKMVPYTYLVDFQLPKRKRFNRRLETWELNAILNVELPRDPRRARTIHVGRLYVVLKLLTELPRRELLAMKISQIHREGIADSHGVLHEWDQLGALKTAVQAFRHLPPTAREPYLIVNLKGKPYWNEEKQQAHGFTSLWSRFVNYCLANTEIADPFYERDLRLDTPEKTADVQISPRSAESMRTFHK